MRVKLLCVVLCVALFFSGCAKEQSVKTNMEFDFEIAAENGTFFINAVKNEGSMKFTVLSPENIKGLTFVFSGNGVDSEFLGHKQSFPLERGDFGVLGSMYRAFTALTDTKAYKNGDEFIAEVTADGENYVFIVTELGIPLSVRFNGTEILFKNITNL